MDTIERNNIPLPRHWKWKRRSEDGFWDAFAALICVRAYMDRRRLCVVAEGDADVVLAVIVANDPERFLERPEGGSMSVLRTALRVSTVERHRRDGKSVEEIMRMFSIREIDVWASFAYATAHPDEIDAEIRSS